MTVMSGEHNFADRKSNFTGQAERKSAVERKTKSQIAVVIMTAKKAALKEEKKDEKAK